MCLADVAGLLNLTASLRVLDAIRFTDLKGV